LPVMPVGDMMAGMAWRHDPAGPKTLHAHADITGEAYEET